MEEKFKQIIEAEIASSNAKDVVELVYELIINKELDKKVIRNKSIKADFNALYRTTMPVMDIYYSLSNSYNVSPDTIRYTLNLNK